VHSFVWSYDSGGIDLPSKLEALISNCSTTKNKQKTLEKQNKQKKNIKKTQQKYTQGYNLLAKYSKIFICL
jgi:hypothetical protein